VRAPSKRGFEKTATQAFRRARHPDFAAKMTRVKIPPKTLSALIGAIYDCALDPPRWERTLGEMVGALNCQNALLSLTDMRHDRLMLTRGFGMDAEWWHAFQKKYVPEVAAQLSSIMGTWPVDKPFVMSRDLSPEVMQRSAYIEGGFGPAGIVDVLQCFLIGSPRRFAGLAFGRGAHQGPFSDREVEMAEILLPHIRRAVTISDLLDAREIDRTHFATALDALRCAVILTDANGRIIHANKSAEDMLREAVTIRDRQGILMPVLRRAMSELSQAIRLAAGDVCEVGQKGLAVGLSEDESFPVLAHVLPLATSELRNRFESVAVAAVFIGGRENARDNAELLAMTYGLTPAETRVVSCLLAGRSPSESARELRVSPTTARTHLRSVFRKTGVSRQQDLLLLAARLSPLVNSG
jgi:DNA-binding CsgD family transcriptional regulator/PAS domain-containing protein